jgi:hypothetical protein
MWRGVSKVYYPRIGPKKMHEPNGDYTSVAELNTNQTLKHVRLMRMYHGYL